MNNRTLTPRKYDTVGAAHEEALKYIERNAPDFKSLIKAMDTTIECTRGLDMDANHINALRNMLYDLSGAFEELADRAHYKAAGRDLPVHAKQTRRAVFYGQIAEWADASFHLFDDKQSPPAKDAEDDSDPPYIPQEPNAPEENSIEWIREKLESELIRAGFSKTQVAAAMRIFNEDVGHLTGLSYAVGSCDLLERFGDSCVEQSYACVREKKLGDEKFWDACVMISDDMRASIAAETIHAREEYAPPMPLVTVESDPFMSAGMMWEVVGDTSRSLCRSKSDAESWARVLFPNELVGKRYARIQSRTIVAKK